MVLAVVFKVAAFLNIFLLFSRVFRGVFLGFRVKFYNVRVLAGLNREISQEIDYNNHRNHNHYLRGRSRLRKLELKTY